jgi:hypothetical protein
MNRIPALLAIALTSLAVPATSQTQVPSRTQPLPGEEARPRDLQRLQEDLANLDGELATLSARDPQADDLRARAEELREEVIYLKVKMRHAREQDLGGTGVTYDEVREVRRAVADLRRDVGQISRGGGGAAGARELRVPAGAEITARLEEPLSSRTARREDRFEAAVLNPVIVAGVVAVPAGSSLRGTVRDAQPAERPSRGGRLELEFGALYIDRDRLDVQGRVVSLEQNADSSTAKKAGLGAVLGGVLGSVLGGKEGAVVGVIVGGGGAVVATKGQDIELPAGAVIVVRLDREVVVPRR